MSSTNVVNSTRHITTTCTYINWLFSKTTGRKSVTSEQGISLILECIDPLVFAGIEVNYTSKTHGSNVTYSCVYGYEITMGDTTLVCENGYWMGNPLICSVTGGYPVQKFLCIIVTSV